MKLCDQSTVFLYRLLHDLYQNKLFSLVNKLYIESSLLTEMVCSYGHLKVICRILSLQVFGTHGDARVVDEDVQGLLQGVEIIRKLPHRLHTGQIQL